MNSFPLLPPAGRFPTSRDFLSAWRKLQQSGYGEAAASGCIETDVANLLKQSLEARSVWMLGSGKQALGAALKEFCPTVIRGSKCILAAYTCPDVAAAVVSVGLVPYFADVNPVSLDINWDKVPEEVLRNASVVILSNLYGLPDAVPANLSSTATVIDDACQAVLTVTPSGRVGLRTDTTCGVISFGRGKAISALGGGAIIRNTAPATVDCPSQEQVDEQFVDAAFPLVDWARCGVLSLLEHPWLYGLVARLPGLNLGTTEYIADLGRAQITCGESVAVAAVLQRLPERISLRTRLRDQWLESLTRDGRIRFPHLERQAAFFIPTRFPLIFPDSGMRDRVYHQLSAAGLGASLSYPKALPEFPQLSLFAQDSEYVGAQSAASCILTLPVHEGVKLCHIERATNIIRAG